MTHETSRDSLGDRQKRYERASLSVLPPRMPIIIRVDGKAFHTFTREIGAAQPFDARLMATMDEAAKAICEEAMGAALAYVQSDEINVLLHPYKRHASQAWFDGEVQKLVSVSASIATSVLTLAYQRTVAFDARVFVVPEADVCNAFVWRQQDATRNSIQMLARSLYSHHECDRKDQAAMQEMIHAAGRNWNDLTTGEKRGRCVIKGEDRRWRIDKDPPIFTQDRAYIERLLAVEAEDGRAA